MSVPNYSTPPLSSSSRSNLPNSTSNSRPPPSPSSRSVSFRSVSFNEITIDTPFNEKLTRRRSSLKGGTVPSLRPTTSYRHSDPLIRRLRLRHPNGKSVNLEKEFDSSVRVVLFLFGASYAGSAESYTLVEEFSRKHPHELKVIYVSVDANEQAYEDATANKPWLKMEWADGSNLSPSSVSSPSASRASTPPPPPPPSSLSSSLPPAPILQAEPFLLASDPDLESDYHLLDPHGYNYLRPFSRVYLAQRFQVLGVPNLVVYHIDSQQILSTRARIGLLKGESGERVWEKWERGEVDAFGIGDIFQAVKWTLGASVLALSYVAAVRFGGINDVVSDLTRSFGSQFQS